MSLRPMLLPVLLAALWGAPAASQDAPATQRQPRAEPTEILVHFRPGTPMSVRALIAQRHGGSIVKSNAVLGYDKIRLIGTRSLAAARAGLEGEPSVRVAEPNGSYGTQSCTACPQDPFLRPLHDPLSSGEHQWGVFTSGVPWLWRQGGGGDAGIKIAIIDTGIDDFASPHPDLAANVHPIGYDFIGLDADPTDAGAYRGHGTHVAGIAAAAANGTGIAGVAYACKLIIVRVLDCAAANDCPGSYDAVADGIQYAADQGARVLNLSLGGRDPSPTVRKAVQYAIARGCIVVAAAGNDSETTLSYPAAYPEVIAVGASDSLDQVPAFSNSGPGLDLVAPGTRILSTWPGPGYLRASGTSQATPLVAGVAAIVASRNPKITSEEMESYLRSHATPLAAANADRDGEGRLSFPWLSDWSDLPPPYGAAGHGGFLWEWLGFDASAEGSIFDLYDTDFRPNIGAPHHTDGYDDGVFPASIPRLPLLPAHFAPGAALDVGLSVSRFDGPRYGADPLKSLHLDMWIDWDGDGLFEQSVPASAEHVVVDHVENPATWGGNGKLATRPIAPVAEHIRGNPLRVRTRLAYGASAGSPDAFSYYGEVEDDHFINFVEDFDVTRRVHSPGVYTITDSWSISPDPWNGCSHRGQHQLARSAHPAIGAPCNGFIERINVLATPTMDWSEYTRASVAFWYCHSASNCSPAGEFCRVRIDTSGVKHDISPIPTGTGMLTLDLTPFVGSEAVIIEFVEHTDWNGRLAIDDLVVSAYDDSPPSPVTNLFADRLGGSKRIDLLWTAPRDNGTVPAVTTQQLASLYDVRYHTAPITSEAAWDAAQRVDPREVLGAALVPGTAGTSQSNRIAAPSAFQTYFLALRTGDEVVSLSPTSNSPSVGALPTLDVAVTGFPDTLLTPGDTADVRFVVKNVGNAPDTYAIEATDTQGWPLLGLPSAIALEPAAEQVFVLPVVTSGGGGDRDSVRLVAWSLADSSVRAEAESIVETTATTDVGSGLVSLAAPGLHSIGPNPFRSEVRFELRASRSELTSVGVYDLSGRLVRRLVDRVVSAGLHTLTWDGRDANGGSVASGVYYLKLRTAGIEQSRGLLRVR